MTLVHWELNALHFYTQFPVWHLLVLSKSIFIKGLVSSTHILQGRVVQKPVNVNPGLSVNRRITFSSLKMFFASNFWCSLKLLQLKTEGQTIQTNYLSKKLQN